MKAWSVIGLLFAATIFAMVPISPQVTPRGLELSVDQAQAITYRRARVTARRVDRRAYRSAAYAVGAGAVGYGVGGYYGGYGYPAYSAPTAPSYGTGYGYGSYYGGYGYPVQLCWLRLSGLWLWRLWRLSHCPPGGDPSSPLALRAWGILIAVRMGAPGFTMRAGGSPIGISRNADGISPPSDDYPCLLNSRRP